MYEMKTLTPARKVTASVTAVALVSTLIWAASTFFGIEVDAQTADAIKVVVVAAAGYFMPPAETDTVVEVQ